MSKWNEAGRTGVVVLAGSLMLAAVLAGAGYMALLRSKVGRLHHQLSMSVREDQRLEVAWRRQAELVARRDAALGALRARGETVEPKVVTRPMPSSVPSLPPEPGLLPTHELIRAHQRSLEEFTARIQTGIDVEKMLPELELEVADLEQRVAVSPAPAPGAAAPLSGSPTGRPRRN